MLNNKLITDPSNMDAYRAYLEKLFNITKEDQDTRLLSECFVKYKNATIATNAPAIADTGLAKRTKLLKNGAIVKHFGRLHLDIFKQRKLLSPKLDFSLNLISSDDKCALLSSKDNAVYK